MWTAQDGSLASVWPAVIFPYLRKWAKWVLITINKHFIYISLWLGVTSSPHFAVYHLALENKNTSVSITVFNVNESWWDISDDSERSQLIREGLLGLRSPEKSEKTQNSSRKVFLAWTDNSSLTAPSTVETHKPPYWKKKTWRHKKK